MESLWLIGVLIGVLLLVIGQVFKLSVFYNLLENSGDLSIKLWFLKIKKLSFKISHNGIIIRTNKKRMQIEYSINDPEIKFYENFSMQVKEKIKIKHISFYSNIGTKDAYHTAMLSALVNIFYKTLAAKVKNIKPTSSVDINAVTSFNQNVCKFSFYGKLSLSIFDFLYCLIFAWLENSKHT